MSLQSTEIATFPPGFFLENVASVNNGDGLLVTVANRQEIYYISLCKENVGSIFQLHKFESDQWPMGIVQAKEDDNKYFVVTTDFLGIKSKTSRMHVIDLADVLAGGTPQTLMDFPAEATGLNGACALSNDTLLVADSFGSCIWQVNLQIKGNRTTASTQKWLDDPLLAGTLVLPDFQPGVNGIKYSSSLGKVFFTNTQHRTFCSVNVNPETLQPEGTIQVIARGFQGDDLIIRDASIESPYAYIATHRDNKVLRIYLGSGSKADANVADLLGPTAGIWADTQQTCAFFITDGGLKNPPMDGRVRGSKVVRLSF